MLLLQYNICDDKHQDRFMKNFKLEVRLTEYESLQLEQEAVRRNMTKSELIRSLIARLPDPLLQKGSRD
jgi:hypothetical protein